MRFLTKVYIIITFAFCISINQSFSQSIDHKVQKKSYKAFKKQINKTYKSDEKSPLKSEDLKSFRKLPIYKFDKTFVVEAKFIKSENEKPFNMPTTTDRIAKYQKYGEVHFEMKGNSYALNVYTNLSLQNIPIYRDYLFFPFTDESNGSSTYGGGRYLDLRINKSGKILIDFNQAYNPYCAYNDRYSCPIVPKENHINEEINAGVKAPDK